MNPVYEAYKMLVAHRDNDEMLDIDEVIGHLGEALGSESDYAEPVVKEEASKECSYSKAICLTKDMIAEAYRKGIIELVVDPNMESGTVAQIGTDWFYFGGQTAEEYGPESYKALVPEADIINEIYEVVKDFKLHFEFADEYEYILSYLREHLPKVAEEMVKQSTVVQSMSTDILIKELLRRDAVIDNYSIHRFLDQSGYLSWKLWSREDIATTLEEEGFAPSEENIDRVIDTGMIKCLEECTDQDWYVIRSAIQESEHNLEKAEVSDDE